MATVRAFWRDETGTTSIEYAVIGTLISILIVGSLLTIGTKISVKFLTPVAGNLS